MQPWFIAVRRFGPCQDDVWAKYIQWSGLIQLEELISLDSILCPSALGFCDDYWDHVVNQDHYLNFFTDLAFLREELRAAAEAADALLLCVVLNPQMPPVLPPELSSFRFVGYDLVEAATGVSALTNCGGWAELDNAELNSKGLLDDHARALALQALLRANHPEEDHANCDLWAIYTE